MSAAQIICATCGSEVPPGEDLCPRCGAAVPLRPPAASPAAAPSPVVPPAASTAFEKGASGPAPLQEEFLPGAVNDVSEDTRTILTGTRQAPGAPVSPTVVLPLAPQPLSTSHPSDHQASDHQPSDHQPLNPYQQEQFENALREAHIHLRRGNLAAAKESCTQAMALDAGSPLVHEMIGIVLETEGDDLSAYREYRLACAEEPAPPEAETRLAKLTLKLPPATLALLQPSAALEKPLPPDAETRLPPEVRATLASYLSAPPVRPKPRAGVPQFASLLVPGLGQLLKQSYLKSAVMFVIWLICVAYLVGLTGSSASNRHTPPVGDPFFWGPALILVIDYVASILDAGAPEN